VLARLSLLAAVFHCLSPHGWTQEVSIERAEGQPGFAIKDDAVTDLSGLTWTGGDAFYAVADHPNLLVPVTLKIDHSTGCILLGEIGTPVPIEAPVSDFESVTYVAATKTFYISAEMGNAVISYRLGDVPRLQPVPRIFSEARKNLSLESITWNDTSARFWIANEEALIPDGPVSGTVGTLVRLQQFDAKFRPVAQYAWRTEPAGFRFRDSGNGVSDLCLLPDGRLIVLERGFALGGLRVRLFLADFKGATDTTKLPALADADFVPAQKTLLFEEATGFINFEGLALGPTLDDGSRSLILIADSNGGTTHAFLPLKVHIGGPSAPHGSDRKATETRRPVIEEKSR
jgi:hypothetical protein